MSSPPCDRPTPMPNSPISNTPLLILVDGHSLAFRSYYAHAKGRDGGLRTSTGIPTSVCYGFLKALIDVLEKEQPSHVAIAFDLDKPTFRHEADDGYKAGRQETPEDFFPDIENLQEILAAFGLSVVTAPGFEADDVIGTLTTQGSAAGYRVKILSGDRDLYQLVDDDKAVHMLYLSNAFGPRKSAGAIEMGVAEVEEKLGVLPTQVVDYKALCGDSSDNIPGVKGIGAKTAVKLLTDYGSLDQIYASIDEIKGAVKKKLEEGKESAEHSRFMAQIRLDVPLEGAIAHCQLQPFDRNVVTPLLDRLEFRQFLKEIPKLEQVFNGNFDEINATQAQKTVNSTTVEPSKEESDRPSLAPSPNDEADDLWFFSPTDTARASQVQSTQIEPQIIDTLPKLTELVQRLQQMTDPDVPVAWDTETTSLEPRDAELVGIGCCWGSGLADMAYIPIGHRIGTTLDKATVLDALRPILESDDHPKVLQNAKFDRLVLRSHSIHLQGVIFDTMLASYVIDPETTHNLTDLALRHLNMRVQSYDDVVPKGSTMAEIAIATAAYYCGEDVYTTFLLVPKLRQALDETPDLQLLLALVEVPVEAVLADMEYQGIRIDADYLKEFSKNLEVDLAKIEKNAYEQAGSTFNLASPKQLSELLFGTLGLDKKKTRKTKTGYSTNVSVLEKLQGDHPVIDTIMEHRTLAKLKSTYVDALPALIRPDTQRVHTDFNQALTATGRLSSSNPNLQNIPIRTAFSRQIRKAFVPEPGWVMVAADYSQIELRILTHLSEEPVLIEAYNNGEDVHTLTAKLLFEKEEITAEERRAGKVINFGIIYGMGANRFARETGVSRKEAQTFIERFNERYPNVFDYLQRMQREAIAHGYVTTLQGRRRYFKFTSNSLKPLLGTNPDDIDLGNIKSPGQYDAGLMRAAANAPIQGSSADIIKIAMVQLHELLQPYQARLLLQVHDELIFEMPPEEWEELAPQIKTTMESAVSLKVPLVVEAHAGANWMDAK
ncbi:MAG: DNA polymerase I [Leptolyngbyaceae bacterium]|nr:DNA polymerase I [Leptolyngbyaceae bacterium]